MSIQFGTDGIRNHIGQNPFTLDYLPKLCNAIAAWSISKYKNPTILICSDTRQSCDWIKATLKSIFLAHPIKILDAGILPTPAVSFLMKQNAKINFSIIVSASHNPYYDNGIKIVEQNSKLSEIDEKKIISLIDKQPNIDYKNIGQEKLYQNASKDYAKNIISLFKPNFLQNKTIVLDTANGSTFKVAPKIFKQLGAEIIVINNKPNGKNINDNCGSLYPEKLINAVKQNNAIIGLAFDGDGDRLIVVNQNGLIKDGDDILAILSNHPDYTQNKSVVATIMSNFGLEKYLKSKNKKLIRTQVGDKHVSKKLEEENLTLGGEQSGHIILKDIVPIGDGILVALKLLETLGLTHNWELKTFDRFPQVNINLPVKIKKDLDSSPIKEIIEEHKKLINLGGIIVRYSGTENLLRIMVEAEDQELAKKTAESLALSLNLELT